MKKLERYNEFSNNKINENVEVLNKPTTFNDIQDIVIPIVNEMVDSGIITDCVDTDDQAESDAQNIIGKHLSKCFNLDWEKIQENVQNEFDDSRSNYKELSYMIIAMKELQAKWNRDVDIEFELSRVIRYLEYSRNITPSI